MTLRIFIHKNFITKLFKAVFSENKKVKHEFCLCLLRYFIVIVWDHIFTTNFNVNDSSTRDQMRQITKLSVNEHSRGCVAIAALCTMLQCSMNGSPISNAAMVTSVIRLSLFYHWSSVCNVFIAPPSPTSALADW